MYNVQMLSTSLHKKILPYFAAFGTILFWSSAFPAVRYALEYFSPGALMIYRFLVASAFLLGYCAIKRVPLPGRRDVPFFAAAGFIGLFMYMWAFNTGTGMVPSGISGFVIAAAPVFTLILSIIFLKEKAGLLIWIGVILSFAGIGVIAFAQIYQVQLNIGVVLLLGAAIFTSIFNILQKRLMRKYTAIQATAYSVSFGTLFMCIFIPDMLRQLPYAPLSANLVVVYLGLFPAAIAYFLWAYALNAVEKTIYITSFIYLSPFLASLMAFWWLGEVVPTLAFVGGVIVIAGMIITNIFKKS